MVASLFFWLFSFLLFLIPLSVEPNQQNNYNNHNQKQHGMKLQPSFSATQKEPSQQQRQQQQQQQQQQQEQMDYFVSMEPAYIPPKTVVKPPPPQQQHQQQQNRKNDSLKFEVSEVEVGIFVSFFLIHFIFSFFISNKVLRSS